MVLLFESLYHFVKFCYSKLLPFMQDLKLKWFEKVKVLWYEDAALQNHIANTNGVGLWHIEKIAYIEGELGYDEWRCEILDKDMVDDNLTAARAMSFLAVMFGLISCFTMLTFCCCGIKESRLRLIYKALCIVFLFVGFCIAMTGVSIDNRNTFNKWTLRKN